MSDKERPAEPGAGDDGTARRGGFAKAAERLNELYPVRRRPISRQLVHKWWLFRHSNGFPESVESTGSGNGGKGRPVFDLTAVETWYAKYQDTRRTAHAPHTHKPHTADEPADENGDQLAA